MKPKETTPEQPTSEQAPKTLYQALQKLNESSGGSIQQAHSPSLTIRESDGTITIQRGRGDLLSLASSTCESCGTPCVGTEAEIPVACVTLKKRVDDILSSQKRTHGTKVW